MSPFKVGDRVRYASVSDGSAGGIGVIREIDRHDPVWPYRVACDGGGCVWRATSEIEATDAAPAAIEYDPPKTRNGFVPGDRVRSVITDREGTVLWACMVPPDREAVQWDDDGGPPFAFADLLRLIDEDTGDPPKTVARTAPIHDTLNLIGAASYLNARAKGFYDRCPDLRNPLWLGTRCMLITTEVAEMMEAIREGDLAPRTGEDGKPEGLPSEMADVVIRLTDLAYSLGINLDKAVAEKMAYNKTRVHLHGKKGGL